VIRWEVLRGFVWFLQDYFVGFGGGIRRDGPENLAIGQTKLLEKC
jgi:hypothetical protein